MAISMMNCKVEVSVNGSTWINLPEANAVEVSGGDRQSADVFFFSQQYAEVVFGPLEAVEVEVRGVYTEGASESFEIVRQMYEGTYTGQTDSKVYVRWSPRGTGAGKFIYTSDAGAITAFTWPGGEASAEPVVFAFTVRTPKITKSVQA